MRIGKWFQDFRSRAIGLWQYVSQGCWRDTRNVWWAKVVKTLNLSVKAFFDTDLQSQAAAMTYRTVLAIVPAFALLFAIGRGFGFQTIITDELYNALPAQHQAIESVMGFVDSYLSTTGEGVFVGIGLAFLLWTLISLIGNVEQAFNIVWDVKTPRTFWRKITDYTAMLLILPVLMICASGLTVFLSNSLQAILHFTFLTPLVHIILEGASWGLTWLFFGMAYILIPNTRVNKGNALIAGVVAGTGFRLLQWLFVTGQVYVTRYNAIYGSFAFLPLLLLWMQLTWVITLSGAVICYASQNITRFAFHRDVKNISADYLRLVTLALGAVVVRRFNSGNAAPSASELAQQTGIPIRLVNLALNNLAECGILSRVLLVADRDNEPGYQPAMPPDEITVARVVHALDAEGTRDFIHDFNAHFPGAVTATSLIANAIEQAGENVLLGSFVTDLNDAEESKTVISKT